MSWTLTADTGSAASAVWTSATPGFVFAFNSNCLTNDFGQCAEFG